MRLLAVSLVALASMPQVRATPGDLEGVWAFATLTPLERPAEFEGKSLVTDAEASSND
jgi:hypothetical protein